MKRILFLLVFGAMGFWAYSHWIKPAIQTFGAWNGQLESGIASSLHKAGVRDVDVVSVKREEIGRRPLKWVRTSRSVEVTAERRLRAEKNLRQFAKSHGFSAVAESSGFEIRKWGVWLQRVTWADKPPSVPIVSQKPKGARAAIVIDDVGYDLRLLEEYATLRVPLTFAILPGDRRAKQFSKKARELGFPVILHLPLQPLDLKNNNPGHSGLYLGMSREEMKRQFDRDVSNVPDLVGLNNHMGSAFTENEPLMTLLLGWVKEKNLFFLDSRTTPKSVGIKVAKRLGVPSLANQTFLDNVDELEPIQAQLDKMRRLAEKRGSTVAIGHYRRKYLLEALRTKIPEFLTQGIEFVGLPELMHP